jgi:antirestriction protein ArdC
MSTSDITSSEDKRDVYQKVTNAIINAIENGNVGNWRMPWHTSGRYAFSPINVVSKKPYRGINTLCLWAASQAKGYESGEWGTYNQFQDRGAQVRRGEKSTTIVFWKWANTTTETQDGDDTKTGSHLLFTKGYSVFNSQQVDGYAPKAEPEAPIEQRIASAEQFFHAIDARVVHLGNRAFYSPSDDTITLPPFAAFFTPLDYYSTRAHETAHWTSHAVRCDRQLGKRFGDNAYAAEELIAELSAAFTCAHLGISTTPREDHAQYIDHWLKVLRADSKAIFTAASRAQQASDWMISHAGQSVQEQVAA